VERHEISKELCRIAALLNDYGISDALVSMVEPVVRRLRKHLQKGELDAARDVYKRWDGKLADLADGSIPADLREVLESYTYDMGVGPFVFEKSKSRVERVYYARYDPFKNKVLVFWNTDYPLQAKAAGVWGKKKRIVLKRLANFDLSVQHEVSHAVRDAETQRIKTYMERMDEEGEGGSVAEFYWGPRGHVEVDFEVDAIINAIARLKRRMGRKWDRMTWDDLVAEQHVLGRLKRGSKPWKAWIKRLHREGLLGKRMRH